MAPAALRHLTQLDTATHELSCPGPSSLEVGEALGGELIRRRYDDDELARHDVADAIAQLIEGDGGPLIWRHLEQLSAVQSCPRPRAGVACDERTTDEVDDSCSPCRYAVMRPQIVRKN